MILVTILSLTISCVSNKVNHGAGIKLYATSGSVILFDRIQGLSDRDSESLFGLFAERIPPCYSTEFIPYLEFEIKSAGINPLLIKQDTASLVQTGKNLNADFVLFVSILNSPTSTNAKTYFELVSIAEPRQRWHFSVDTDIKSLVWNGDLFTVSANILNDNSAIKKSFLRGIQELNTTTLKWCD